MKKRFLYTKVFLIIIAAFVWLSNSNCTKLCPTMIIPSDSTLVTDSTGGNTNDSIPDNDSTEIPVDSLPAQNDSTKLDSIQSTIFGEWLGTYYDPNHENPEEYDMLIKKDFTMTFTSKTPVGTNTGGGTWKLIGTEFSADIITKTGNLIDIGVEQSLTAIYDGYYQTFTDGIWNNIKGHSGNGYFEMKKIRD